MKRRETNNDNQLEGILMAFSEQQIEKAVREILADQVSAVVDSIRSQVESDLEDLASEVESVASNYVHDAVRNVDLDENTMTGLIEGVTERLYADFKDLKPDVAAVAPPELTDQERYAPLRPALEGGDLLPVYMSVFTRPPRPEEIHEILNYIAATHEPTMAMFYWNYMRQGGAR